MYGFNFIYLLKYNQPRAWTLFSYCQLIQSINLWLKLYQSFSIIIVTIFPTNNPIIHYQIKKKKEEEETPNYEERTTNSNP